VNLEPRMQKRSPEQTWKIALAVIALVATAMALYIQLFDRKLRQEEERLSAARLDEALAESRTRLRAEILEQLRAEGSEEKSTEPPGDQPLPNAVLRRGESGTLEQFVGPMDAQQARDIAELRKGLDALSRQLEQSELARRRDLEELRAEVRRDLDASGRTVSLLLVALVPLVAQLVFSIWQPRRRRTGEERT
jgi:type II secretory pathway pseudopilin PulG